MIVYAGGWVSCCGFCWRLLLAGCIICRFGLCVFVCALAVVLLGVVWGFCCDLSCLVGCCFRYLLWVVLLFTVFLVSCVRYGS